MIKSLKIVIKTVFIFFGIKMGKIFLVAKNIAIFAGKLRKFCIKTKVSFWHLFIMLSLHSFLAKMAIFLATRNIFSHFYGP